MELGKPTVEDLGMTDAFWQGRRTLITGHTGFKGSWLALWLRELGAHITGYSLRPPSSPSLYDRARVAELVDGVEADVRDFSRLREAFASSRPDVVFHLAAQSLVRPSYERPVETFGTNVMGTVHVLEAALQEHKRPRSSDCDERQVLRESGMGVAVPGG